VAQLNRIYIKNLNLIIYLLLFIIVLFVVACLVRFLFPFKTFVFLESLFEYLYIYTNAKISG
jgi:hypothetical protein